MPEMPRKAARDGLPGGPGGARGYGWAARGMGGRPGVWVGGPGHGWAARGMGGRPEAPPIAPTPSPTGVELHRVRRGGATHSPHTVAHGGNCTNRATTRRRHAVKQLLMLQNPPITRQEGTTRTEQPGHDAWERRQRPRSRQLNHHERSLGSAASPAAPASAPGHGPATQLVERVPPPCDNTSG